MKSCVTLVTLGLGACFMAGCASSPLSSAKSPAAQRAPIQEPVLPRLQAYPVNPSVNMSDAVLVMEEPQPVWRPTRIQKVQLDAYVDEKGNLHKPSAMYVRVEEGNWNLEAVRRPGGYIPPENSVTPYNLPGVNYGPSYTVPRAQPKGPAALFDMRDVRITGLTSKADRELAESMAGTGEIALHDPRVGWIVVPQSSMQGAVNMPSDINQVPSHSVTRGKVQPITPAPLPSVSHSGLVAPTRPEPEAVVTPEIPASGENEPTDNDTLENDLFDDL